MLHFCLFVLSVSSKNITIARNGEISPYSIVIPTKKNDKLKNHEFAANHLQEYIYNITNVRLNITRDDEPLPEKAILIGNTAYTKKVCSKMEIFTENVDDFHWICTENYILLNGGNRGICYGVYELLERYGNVRYFSKWMVVIPPAETFEIPADLDFYSKPSFIYRETTDGDLEKQYDWYSYNRYDSGANYILNKQGSFKYHGYRCHSIHGLIHGNEFTCKDYPERYALLKEGGTERSPYEPCLSNEENYKIAKAEIISRIEHDKDHDFIEVSKEDYRDFCHCPQCMVKYMKYGNTSSGIWIEFLNRLLDDINPIYPNIYLRTLAFYDTMVPPKNIIPHKNILIRLCEFENDHAIPIEISNNKMSKLFMKSLEGWCKISDKVLIYMYVSNYWCSELIFPTWFTIGKNLQTYHKYGAWGTYFSLSNNNYVDKTTGITVPRVFTCFDKLKSYVHQKLSWNITLDPDDAINDFLRGYYGPKAAPYIRQYMDDAYNEIKKWNNTVLYTAVYPSVYEVYEPLRTTFMEHGYKLWQRAIKEASTDTDPRFLYNTQTGSVSHCMSIFRYQKYYHIPAKWTFESITNQPSKLLKEISENIPQYCPDQYDPDPRSQRVCYLGKEEKDTFAREYFSFITDVVTPNVIVCGESKFASKEGFYCGRGGLLSYKGWNYIEYNNGGFDFNVMTSEMDSETSMYLGYQLNQTQRGNFKKIGENSYQYSFKEYVTSKRYESSGNGVKGIFSVKYNEMPPTKLIHTVVTVSCNLGDDGSAVACQRGEKWIKLMLNENQKTANIGFKDNAKTFTLVSPSTGKGMLFSISKNPESVTVELNRTSKTYTAYICFNHFNTLLASDDVTITPLSDITVPNGIPEKKNEVYKYMQLEPQYFSTIDQYFENSKYKGYMGGDDKSTTGRAFIVDYIGIDSSTYSGSPKIHKVRIENGVENRIHYRDTYNFSLHIRCDIKDPNEDAFTEFFHERHSQVTMKNVSEYVWVHSIIRNINCRWNFYVQPKKGAERCYIDEFRANPVTLSPGNQTKPIVIPPVFTIKEHEPMPPVDLYRLHYTDKKDEIEGGKTGVIVGVSIGCIIAAVLIIAISVYFYRRRKQNNENSDVEALTLV